ncbi:bifunctional 2-polyprenyl-6-hydroxyphenol methylase/3-demethylubiquinol 3-O-methyltransferase UbiG [Pikeienuella sp. HZG-20]|uniref:bifunctional 2-polyprenyl-6-hydroxyphenol methylase/3-demethylubiquinol 3-O-methyltransferase UbiG n=1 Tax=Paludibacillus litoralis TaxID=3133267 RepID=UPI0030EF39A4
MSISGTADAAEIAKFEAMAAEWWDPDGKFRPLHAMNPCRLDYIAGQIAAEFGRNLRARRPFDGLAIADIGCGGGLTAEPMARLGAAVAGFDAAEESLAVARAHAAAGGLDIDYRAELAEDAAARGARYDVVLALEIVEHVADPAAFAAALGALLRPGGMAILSTLNRTPESYAAAIVGAEHILRWLPRGTHDWRKFPTPDELEALLAAAGLDVVDAKGMVPDLTRGGWRLSAGNLRVNYIMTAIRPADGPKEG